MSLARSRVLTPAAERQLADVRTVLADLRDVLARVAGDRRRQLRRWYGSIRQLDDLFLLVVVGEFNAGKSAFINALLGERVLEEGVTPTTARIQLVRYGDTITTELDGSGGQVVTAPVELLRDLHIVDTPGTNAIIREHERLTREFVPRADLVLFVTSADHPFTETERTFLETIREWGKKVVIVVNKWDILERDDQRTQVLDFVRDAATRQLATTPEIFPASARLAWRARHGEPEAWAPSGFELLERFVQDTLDDERRFALKLANPLGVGEALARRYEAAATERLALLTDDIAAVDDTERQLALYAEDLARGFELRMSAVENVLLEMEARGHAFIEDTLRMGRVFDLLNRSRVQQEFEDRVVGDAATQVDRRVSELIDWLVDQDFRQWQALSSRLTVRQRAHGDRVLGGGDVTGFHADRSRLLDSVGREAQRVVETYDRRGESRALADSARTAVAATAAMGASAIGLGAVVAAVASTAAVDITGMLAAGVAGRGRAAHHPREAPPGPHRTTREDLGVARAARGSPAQGVRGCPRPQHAATRRRPRTLQPLRSRGADALERPAGGVAGLARACRSPHAETGCPARI
jgi:small GTP-binding protein